MAFNGINGQHCQAENKNMTNYLYFLLVYFIVCLIQQILLAWKMFKINNPAVLSGQILVHLGVLQAVALWVYFLLVEFE